MKRFAEFLLLPALLAPLGTLAAKRALDAPEPVSDPALDSAPTPDATCGLVFPLPLPCDVPSNFGDPRGGHRHEGLDMMAPKMTPVRAVASGTVRWMHDERGGRCCDLELVHDDGWRSRYIHLNNDTPGTDDGKGWGFADGVVEGARVEAGQVIGYVGDSGNAENAGSHLHFELRTPDGVAVDPRDGLVAASRQAAGL